MSFTRAQAAAMLPRLMVRARRHRGRYLPNIEASGGCWNWLGSNVGGNPRWTPTRGKCYPVRRIVFVACRGPLADDDIAYAMCGNRKCIAPAHLTVHARVHWQHSARVKLSDGEVAQIRRRYASGELQADLGDEFGVARAYISQLCSGRSRWSVPGLGPGHGGDI